ncbi:ABC transporter permease [Pseudonocardia eucalypti]|uniref:ABC transporter permease n=1 Tax=Pseudonocardia eucalypti TaxID=648755 RepID=A0ABP9QK12_9PSEU|nr:phospholipid/cholesterol/gamma-HCH transport system permease protein [Pseudonocardia eucalypti]
MTSIEVRSVGGRVGGFFVMTVDAFRAMVRRPFQARELIEQAWFVVTVSLLPTFLISIPFCVIMVFQINQLLIEIGASDLSGAGAGLTVVREIGPVVSVLVVAGAGGTALCADLGARAIREEIDAMEVMGIDPIHRLVAPRVLALSIVALALNGVVTLVGLTGSFLFSIFVQKASAGLFVANLTLLTGLSDFLVSEFKALVFGVSAGLVSCYLGLTVSGGAKGVGQAVNQSVVFSFALLFLANSLITGVFLQYR